MSKHSFFRVVFLILVLLAVFYWQNYWLATGVVLLFSLVLFFGVWVFQWNYFFTAKHRINPEKKAVILTFDDGPMPLYTEKILAVLNEKEVKAVFFLVGKNAEENPDLVRKIRDEGHAIGHHSYSHSKWFPTWNTKKVVEDVLRGAKTIVEITGKESRLFRPPFGLTNPNIANAVRYSGFQPIGWSLRSLDTMVKSKEKLVHKILSRVEAGDIILLHDWGKYTAEALPEIIDGIRANGLEFTAELSD